jgi:hypothetical protein
VQPPWVVVRWAYGDCKIWRNDIRAPRKIGLARVAQIRFQYSPMID